LTASAQAQEVRTASAATSSQVVAASSARMDAAVPAAVALLDRFVRLHHAEPAGSDLAAPGAFE